MKKNIIIDVLFISILKSESQVLPVHLATQEQDQWCWAEVSACILDYYC
jgi:hypothetical protein